MRVAQSIINLALITGNIGRPGTGANSITGQCNAMGSRLFSNTTNLLGGHAFESARASAKVAKALEVGSCIPQRQSRLRPKSWKGFIAAKSEGLWVIATNTAHSWINQSDAKELLAKLDFLVVQDMYHSTETAAFADLILPAAGWGEKEGTFINSERRISLLKKVSRAPGEALADFYILSCWLKPGVQVIFQELEQAGRRFPKSEEDHARAALRHSRASSTIKCLTTNAASSGRSSRERTSKNAPNVGCSLMACSITRAARQS